MANKEVLIPQTLPLKHGEHFVAEKKYHTPEDFDAAAFSIEIVPFLVDAAINARETLSDSYRVKVGAAGAFYNRQKSRLKVFKAGNIKKRDIDFDSNTLGPDEFDKFCAESGLLVRADTEQYPTPLVIAVAGPGDPNVIKSINKDERETATLMPCNNCCEQFEPRKDLWDATLVSYARSKTEKGWKDLVQTQSIGEWVLRSALESDKFEQPKPHEYQDFVYAGALESFLDEVRESRSATNNIDPDVRLANELRLARHAILSFE